MPTPESLARQIIDQKLTAAGWIVQDFKTLNLGTGTGVAVREFQTASCSSIASKSGPPLRMELLLRSATRAPKGKP